MVATPFTTMNAENKIPIWKSPTPKTRSIWLEVPLTMY